MRPRFKQYPNIQKPGSYLYTSRYRYGGGSKQNLTFLWVYQETQGTYSFSVPPGVNQLFVVALGGGGSGALTPFSSNSCATGGGGGALIVALIKTTPGTTYSYTVGAGGGYNAYTSNTSANGGNGSATSLENMFIAGGGSGGTYGNWTANGGNGGIAVVNCACSVLASSNGGRGGSVTITTSSAADAATGGGGAGCIVSAGGRGGDIIVDGLTEPVVTGGGGVRGNGGDIYSTTMAVTGGGGIYDAAKGLSTVNPGGGSHYSWPSHVNPEFPFFFPGTNLMTGTRGSPIIGTIPQDYSCSIFGNDYQLIWTQITYTKASEDTNIYMDFPLQSLLVDPITGYGGGGLVVIERSITESYQRCEPGAGSGGVLMDGSTGIEINDYSRTGGPAGGGGGKLVLNTANLAYGYIYGQDGGCGGGSGGLISYKTENIYTLSNGQAGVGGGGGGTVGGLIESNTEYHSAASGVGRDGCFAVFCICD